MKKTRLFCCWMLLLCSLAVLLPAAADQLPEKANLSIYVQAPGTVILEGDIAVNDRDRIGFLRFPLRSMRVRHIESADG